MNSADPWSDLNTRAGLLVDTNLLVLFIVGAVNLDRIESFKRTRQYSKTDCQLLLRVIDGFTPLYTLAHVMAEVSNLTDLAGPEPPHRRLPIQTIPPTLPHPYMATLPPAPKTPPPPPRP